MAERLPVDFLDAFFVADLRDGVAMVEEMWDCEVKTKQEKQRIVFDRSINANKTRRGKQLVSDFVSTHV